jgi:hypothetical protein
MSTKRRNQLETLLRKLRQRAFNDERCTPLIHQVKARLVPAWRDESNARAQYHWMYAAE